MAYTTPRTWTAGETVTAAIMNTHVRDNLAAIVAAQPLIIPAARVTHDANQSIPNSSATAIAFNTETLDTDTMHDNSTNNTRLTCKTAGIYSIFAQARFASNATGDRILAIVLNGTTTLVNQRVPAVNGNVTSLNVYTEYSLAVNDYVEATAFQNSGGALNVQSDGVLTPVLGMSYKGKAA